MLDYHLSFAELTKVLVRRRGIRLHGTRSMISFNAALAYEEVFDVDTTPT